MTVSYDVFSETNPGFCAYALAGFVAAYSSIKPDGPEVPLIYMATPIAFSGDLASTFNGTNKNTGLLEWLERSPQVRIGLSERLNASMSIVTEGLRFSCFTKILTLDEAALLKVGTQKTKKSAVNLLSKESAQTIKHAERLGYWFALAGSTRTIFNIFGLTV